MSEENASLKGGKVYRVEPTFDKGSNKPNVREGVLRKVLRKTGTDESTTAASTASSITVNQWLFRPFSSVIWFMAIPGRIWFVLRALAVPFQILGFVLDMLVSAAVVGIMIVIWLWWTHAIPDDQVASFLGEIGSRGLGILNKSGIMP